MSMMSCIATVVLIASVAPLCHGLQPRAGGTASLEDPPLQGNFKKKSSPPNLHSESRRSSLPAPAVGNKTQAQMKAEEDAANEKVVASVITGVIEILSWIIALVFAVLYKRKVVDQIPKLEPKPAGSRGKDFTPGLFDCFGDLQLCLHVTCCSACRAAHTFSITGAIDYGLSIVLQTCCAPFFCFIGGIWLRPKVRTTLGLEPDGCKDCLLWTFCLPCVVGQEALEVDELSNVNIRCCFNVVPKASETTEHFLEAPPEVTEEPANVTEIVASEDIDYVVS